MLTRALIVMLLLLNLGAAAWWAMRPAPRASLPDAALAGVPKLQLASERQATAPAVAATPVPVAAASTPAVAAATPIPAPQCFRFGPFADAGSAEAAAAKLRASVRRATTATTHAGGKDWTVWLPPFADMTAAQAKALEIATAGIKDFQVVAQGAQANAIMLGRYGSEDGARRRVAELHGQGVEAQVLAPKDANLQAWVDVAADAGFASTAARARIGARGVQPLDCMGLH